MAWCVVCVHLVRETVRPVEVEPLLDRGELAYDGKRREGREEKGRMGREGREGQEEKVRKGRNEKGRKGREWRREKKKIEKEDRKGGGRGENGSGKRRRWRLGYGRKGKCKN